MLDLLKHALLSKTPLTDLFLEMKPCVDKSSIFSCDFKNILNSCMDITVKLLIRKSDGNILYAQGGQDFADFINKRPSKSYLLNFFGCLIDIEEA